MKAQLKEHPVLMSAPMVRALLDGTKAQTRRVVKGRALEMFKENPEWKSLAIPFCPYGARGDRLWVREAWRAPSSWDDTPPRGISDGEPIRYIADEVTGPDAGFGKYRPSMFMLRWASRITLQITGIRIERLQDISETHARAEGVEPEDLASEPEHFIADYRGAYQTLWEQLNGAGSWDLNPWVWVVEFRRVGGGAI